MIETLQLAPGVTLRYCAAGRFKKGALSIQLLRPMALKEAASNALLPAVLLRGTENHPDLRSITEHLDSLYGAGIGTMVRRIGDIQTVGLYLSFMEDRFAMEGDAVLAPMIGFLEEILLHPLTENGVFPEDFVDSEKRNLISAIESELNDKRTYTANRMLRQMCQGDSFAVPRLGRVEDVQTITPEGLFAHYQDILRTSSVEIFYVGSASKQEVSALLLPLAKNLATKPVAAPCQTPFVPVATPMEFSEEMEVSQGKLSMGFTCGITNRSPDFAAMQVFNALYGAGMTSKLFVNVREKMSLCYYASSSYYGTKGIFTVSSGIDPENYETTKNEILHQLQECKNGCITPQELESAKKSLLSTLRSIPDSPGALENYYGTATISDMHWDIPEYMDRIQAVTTEDVVRVARTIELHTVFFLRGVAR